MRLIGIDSPELGQGEPGRQAQAALRRLMPKGTTVRLERDAAPRDRYGRELAYVWVGSRLVNESMVRDGWAMLYTVPPNVKYAERLERAQKEARAAARACGRAEGSRARRPRGGSGSAQMRGNRPVRCRETVPCRDPAAAPRPRGPHQQQVRDVVRA